MCVCMEMHACMPSLKIKQEINGQKNVYAITHIVNQLQFTAPTAYWKLIKNIYMQVHHDQKPHSMLNKRCSIVSLSSLSSCLLFLFFSV